MQLDKDECDNMLLELMGANMVPEVEAFLIYQAVHEFGQAAWVGDEVLRNRPQKI